MSLIELWEDIESYQGLYLVSNLGNVKSLNRKTLNKKGVMMSFKGRVLSKCNDKDGYKMVGLTKNKHTKTKRIHRLVADAFIPNPDNLPQVNHINGIKDDNRVENLEWCTASYNQKHSVDVLKRKILKGQEVGGSLLTEILIEEMIIEKNKGKTYNELEEIFGIKRATIHAAIRYNWKHMNKDSIENFKIKQKKGDSSPHVKVSDQHVYEIYILATTTDLKLKEIAEMYNTSFRYVSLVKNKATRRYTLEKYGVNIE